MTTLYCWFMSRMKSEEGAALTEYALLVALIAVACITRHQAALGRDPRHLLTGIATALVGP